MTAEQFIKQEGASDPQQYRRRVVLLAAIYLTINVVALLVLVLLAWHIRFWVMIAARTNAEALIFALIFVLFSYLYVISFRGTLGALRIFYHNVLIGSKQREASKQRALPGCGQTGHRRAYTDVQVLQEGKEDEPIVMPLQDEAGSLGELRINGVRLYLKASKKGISNSVFEYIVNQIEQIVGQRNEADEDGDDGGTPFTLNVVAWQTIDEETAIIYYHQAEAFRRLANKLGDGEQFWPSIHLRPDEIEQIKQRLTELVPTLRDEAMMPDVEYTAEYNVPIIPEPLGFVRLTRTEQRADPVATMGCAMLVVIGIAALLIYFILLPPWLPAQ